MEGRACLQTLAWRRPSMPLPAGRREGPYVKALFPESEYPRVHAEFLRAGVLLCPGYPGPSVLPGRLFTR